MLRVRRISRFGCVADRGHEVVSERRVDEVDVCLVHEEHAVEPGRDRLEGLPVEEPSRRGVGVWKQGEARAAAVERVREAVRKRPVFRQG